MSTDVAGPDGSALSEGLGPRCRSETGDVMLCADAACGWMGRCVAAEPMEPGEGRDCQHGQLARACDRCADAREIAELRAALKTANDQAERFERGWYLRGDALEWIVEATTATPALTEVGLGVVLAQIGRKAADGLRA
jgi:hypothetical protein